MWVYSIQEEVHFWYRQQLLHKFARLYFTHLNSGQWVYSEGTSLPLASAHSQRMSLQRTLKITHNSISALLA